MTEMTTGNKKQMLRFIPGLAALRRYDRTWLRFDLLAGISVAAVALPIAIAYSQLAGVPPVYGLYASLLPLLAYALFGTSRQLIIAPDAATCAIVAAVVLPLAGPDMVRYLSLTAALAIIAGVLCIAAGLARLGFLTNFLARPILTGYLNGIAICIITGQLGTLFGFKLAPQGFFRLLWEFSSKLGATHGPTLLVGATTLALLLVLARLAPKVPGPLVAVVLGIAGSAFFGLRTRFETAGRDSRRASCLDDPRHHLKRFGVAAARRGRVGADQLQQHHGHSPGLCGEKSL
jgi:MFS superfamily sulfate permease-like transporter